MDIGILLFPNNTQLDLCGPQEVFCRLPGARVLLVAAAMDPVRSDHGMRMLPDLGRGDCPQLDLLCVPGGAGINDLIRDDPWLDFIAAQGARAAYVTSVCTGALALGAAGLLQGYRATTHWLYTDILELCGAIPTAGRVVQDRNRFTGGGVTAGIDLALRVAAEVAGPDTAKSIQLAMEYRPDSPFRSGHPEEADAALVEAMAHSEAERAYHAMRLGLVREALARRH